MGLRKKLAGKNKYGYYLRKKMNKIKKKGIPQHIAIIMDGNGRWAIKKGLPRTAGHRQGMESLRDIVTISGELGIKYLTIYAFSTENWKRPESEIRAIMDLLVEYLEREIDELDKNQVKIKVLGDIQLLPANARKAVVNAQKRTQLNSGLQVNVALNYGGRAEIINAVKELYKDLKKGNIILDEVDEMLFSEYLYTAGIPDPDLLIRTGGDLRISNFLLYQVAYTELCFTSPNIFWPNFNSQIYMDLILGYQNRQRRYGGIQAGRDE